MTSIFRLFTNASLAMSLLSLAACGGGGDDDGAPPATGRSAAEGAYVGSITGSPPLNAFEMLVLEDGSYWTIYGYQTSSTFYIGGFVQGSGTAANGQFSSSNARDFASAPAASGSVTASYVPGSSISGTLRTAGGASASFSGTTNTTPYNYHQPATLSDITGNWNMQTLSGESTFVTIGANGTVSAISFGGCSFNGTVQPRASGKNVFNVNLTFGPLPCVLPGQAASGIAIFIPSTPGHGQLNVLAIDGSRSFGDMAFGSR